MDNWERKAHQKSQNRSLPIKKWNDDWVWQPVTLDSSGQRVASKFIGEVLNDDIYECGFCRGSGEKPRGSKCPVCCGKGSVSVNPPAVICAYCKGSGEEKPRSNITCTVCRGKGIVQVKEPVEKCPHCSGRGKEPTNKLPCITCRGSGVVTVKEKTGAMTLQQEIEKGSYFKPGKKGQYLEPSSSSKPQSQPAPKVKSREKPHRQPSGSEKEAMEIIYELGAADRVAVGRRMLVSSSYADYLCKSLVKTGLLIWDSGKYALSPVGEGLLVKGNKGEKKMKSPDVRALAKKEIVREKHRILRKKRNGPSLLEETALAWKRKKKAEEGDKEKERLQSEVEQSTGFREFSAQQTVLYDKEKLFQDTGWIQYQPLEKERNKEEEISLNMSTIRAMAKRLIAREWGRALGKSQSSVLDNLEREASSWKERKDEEKIKEEELKQKIKMQNRILKEALYQFGQKLRQEKEALKPEMAASLLDEALDSVGEVIDIEWHKKACYIWLEPWEEKKMRRISGDTLPVVYRAKIDQKLNLASYEQVDRESIRLRMKERMWYKPLQGLLIKDEEEAEEVLEETLSKVGQIIDLKRIKKGWTVHFEPWEKVRERNLENKGKDPVVIDQIEVNWSKGKFSLVYK